MTVFLTFLFAWYLTSMTISLNNLFEIYNNLFDINDNFIQQYALIQSIVVIILGLWVLLGSPLKENATLL